jgi:hypothetical protein
VRNESIVSGNAFDGQPLNAFVLRGSLKIGEAGGLITGRVSGSSSWDPPSIANNASASFAFGLPGAQVGDTVLVGFSPAVPGGVLVTGVANPSGMVTVSLLNTTGAPLDLPSSTVRAEVWKH